MPWQLPVLLAHQFGLPPLVSGRFLPEKPAVVGLGLYQRTWEWAVAFRVRSGAELVAELSTGSSARFAAERRGDVVLLRGASRTLAVVDSTLVVAASEPALERYAIYLARTPEEPISPQADASLRVTPGAGSLFDDFILHGAERVTALLQGALAEQISARGTAPDLLDTAHLFGLFEELVQGGRARVRAVRGGSLSLALSKAESRLSGELSVDRGRRDALSASCPELALPLGVSAAVLLPREVLGEAQLSRLRDALYPPGADPDRVPPTGSFSASVAAGPVVFAVAADDPPRWLLQTRLVDPGAVALPFEVLESRVAGELFGPRTFLLPRHTFGASGSLTTTGAEPPWHLSFVTGPERTRWALGADSKRWLVAGDVDAARLFPNWRVLCASEPWLGVGFARGDVPLDVALAKRDETVTVAVSLPTSLWLEWLSR
jgi:hypothetical protein